MLFTLSGHISKGLVREAPMAASRESLRPTSGSRVAHTVAVCLRRAFVHRHPRSNAPRHLSMSRLSLKLSRRTETKRGFEQAEPVAGLQVFRYISVEQNIYRKTRRYCCGE